MFADDTTMTVIHQVNKILEQTACYEGSLIVYWISNNGFKINTSNTKYINLSIKTIIRTCCKKYFQVLISNTKIIIIF